MISKQDAVVSLKRYSNSKIWSNFFVLLFAFPTATFGIVTYFTNDYFIKLNIPTGDTIIFVAFVGILAWIPVQVLYEKWEGISNRNNSFVLWFHLINCVAGLFVWYYLMLQAVS